MNEDAKLLTLLREAMPPIADAVPSRDLWPLVMKGEDRRWQWSWLDAGLAAGVALALVVRPDWLVVLTYHL